MSDNLKLQTVWVPLKDGTKPTKTPWYGLEQLDNRIILTPQELNDLLLEYHPGMVNDPKPFLKSKGIDI